MPSGNFIVESFEHSVRGRYGNARREVRLVSRPAFHAIRTSATLHFFDDADLPDLEGYAVNVGGANFNGIGLYANLRLGDYADMRQILQTEAPVTVTWYHRDLPSSPGSTTKLLTGIIVGTGDEPPGEGFRDPDRVDLP